jgi:predicted DNA-binding protein
METSMRSILTISLPAGKKALLTKRAKKAGKTVSGYILSIIELEEQLISEDDLLAMAVRAEKDYRAGKTKILKSLNELM